jgi:N-acetyl sugar amidotransferase
MNWCKNCIMPDSRPGIVINEEGICGACQNSVKKHTTIDWEARENEFKQLAEKVKSRDSLFDCVIPVSGGKDSTWQLIKCLEYGLTPLAVTWKTPGRTAIGQENLDNLVNIGVDHIDWQINPQIEKKFIIKSFDKFGTTAIPMHMAIINIPLTIALRFDIPLVIFGENAAFEYGSGGDDSLTGFKMDQKWLDKFGVMHGTTAVDWIDDDLSKKDLGSYFGPSDKELDARDICSVFLGHYFKWDVNESLEVATKYGFKGGDQARTGIYDFADIDDDFISIHHWMKWYKFGMTRSFDNLSLEIRAGRIKRDEAISIIRERGEERPVKDINGLCQFLEISESDFMQIAEKHRNHDIWVKENGAWKIRDFLVDDWGWE